ncbi:hypothetical protein [Tessaracoccus sp.]
MEKMPLVGLSEIAQAAGVQKSVVAMWRIRHQTFPEPVADLRTGAVFWWPEVERWLLRTGRPTAQGWSLEQINAYQKGPRTITVANAAGAQPAPSS